MGKDINIPNTIRRKVAEAVSVEGKKGGIFKAVSCIQRRDLQTKWVAPSIYLTWRDTYHFGSPLKEVYFDPNIAILELKVGPHPIEYIKLPEHLERLYLRDPKIRLDSIDIPYTLRELHCLNTIQVNGFWDKVSNGELVHVRSVDPEYEPINLTA